MNATKTFVSAKTNKEYVYEVAKAGPAGGGVPVATPTVQPAIAALAVEGTCVARFSDWLLLEGKPKPKLADTISEKLETAFAGQSFQVNVEEVR